MSFLLNWTHREIKTQNNVFFLTRRYTSYWAAVPFTSLIQLYCYPHLIIERATTQPTHRSWANPPHHHLAIGNSQQLVNFSWVVLFPLPLLPMLCSADINFLHQIPIILPREQPKLSPQTEIGLPFCSPALPTTIGSSRYISKAILISFTSFANDI